MNAAEIREMNARIALRRDEVDAHDDFLAVPVRGPAFAVKVLDTGVELLAIHRLTGEPYPMDLRRDLSPEDAAIVVSRRILRAGGTRAEVERFLEAFDLAQHVVNRLRRALEEVSS